MTNAHALHVGARAAYRATRRVDTAGAWRPSGPCRTPPASRRRGYEPSQATAAAYRTAYPRHTRQAVRSEDTQRIQRPARPSYGGSGQSYRRVGRTRYAAAYRHRLQDASRPVPTAYASPSYGGGRRYRARGPVARTGARHANPVLLSAAAPRRVRRGVHLTGNGRPVGAGATGGRRVFRGTATTRYTTGRSRTSAARPSKVRVRRGTGLRDRLGRATAMTVSNAAQAGTDRTDIVDTMGHTAMELTARVGMTATGVATRAVGRTAGAARDVMNRDRRALTAAYKAERKTSRQLDKALRKGKPGAARNKRIADSRRRAGRPTALSDARPSASIGRLAAKGKASRRIGKRIGGGLRKTAKGVKRLGSTGLDWMDEASARITAADDDPASQLGDATRDLTFKAARKGVRGVTSSARFIWCHRHAPARAVRGARAAASTGARVARAAVNLVRAAVSRVAAGAASISFPVLPIIAALIAVLGVLLAVMGAFLGSSASESTGVANVPAEYEADVIRAGLVCEIVTPSIIAAQIEAESNWDPNAGSPAGAQGIAQFMPGTWASVGMDGDNDGKADVRNPHDAIWTQGNYMCRLASQVEGYKQQGRLAGDTLQLTLAAYNAGIGAVLRAGMIPPYSETTNYVKKIMNLAQTKYTATGGTGGGAKVGTLNPKLTVSAAGIVSTAGIDLSPGSTYAQGQCTWWAAIRRAQIGKPVDGYMGNGGDWATSARRLGYPVSSSPQPGDAICFGRGVLGADTAYGHIAIVEEVHKDGSILISEANVKGVGVVSTRSITAAQLKAAGGGVQYIH